MADVFLDCLFVGPYRTHEVSPTPEVTVSIFVLQVRVTVEYQKGTFPFRYPMNCDTLKFGGMLTSM